MPNDPYLIPRRPADTVRSVAEREGVSPDIADDYLALTKIESGHNVNVRDSSKGAQGFGQVMPDRRGGSTRTIGKRVYNLRNPAENIAAGLSYFAEGGSDPVGRRLHYFGGPGARQAYERTGRIPNISDGNMTAEQYVRATGGYRQAQQDPYLITKPSRSTPSTQTVAPVDDPYLIAKPSGQTPPPSERQTIERTPDNPPASPEQPQAQSVPSRSRQGGIFGRREVREAIAGQARQLYETALTPDEEQRFQQWKTRYAPRDSGADYDLRGAFKAGLQPDARTGHWPDRFKKPNHPTFSNESQYAVGENAAKAGHWEGEKFIPPVIPIEQALANLTAQVNTSNERLKRQASRQQPPRPATRSIFSRPEVQQAVRQPASSPADLRRIDAPEVERIQRHQAEQVQRDPFLARTRTGGLTSENAQYAANRASEERIDEERQAVEQPQLDELTRQYREQIKEAARLTPNYGPTQWFQEALHKAEAGLLELGAAATRGVVGVSRDPGYTQQLADKMRLHAQAMQQAAIEEGADRNVVSRTLQDATAGLISTVPELAAMSLGAPPIATFAVGGGARAYGRGERLPQVAKEAAHGAATGALFELPIPSRITSPLGRAAAKAATVGGATTGMELATGTPPEQAIASGLTNAAFAGHGEISRRSSPARGQSTTVARETGGDLPLYRTGEQGRGVLRERYIEEYPGEAKSGTQPDVPAQREAVERQPTQTETATAPDMVRQLVSVNERPDDGGERGGVNAGDARPNETGAPQRYFHRDYGEVVESPNQKRLDKRKRVRVVAEDGSEHIIKRSARTGAGKQRAVPIRESQPVEQQAESQPAPEVVAVNRQQLSSERFNEVLLRESVGGNAGPNRAAVNMLADPAGRIVAIGNFQELSPELQRAYHNGELHNVTATVHYPEGLRGEPQIERITITGNAPEAVRRAVEAAVPAEQLRAPEPERPRTPAEQAALDREVEQLVETGRRITAERDAREGVRQPPAPRGWESAPVAGLTGETPTETRPAQPSSPPRSLSRNFRAGTNDAQLTFASELQRDLYDLAAKERYQMRGGRHRAGMREVGDVETLRRSVAARLGIDPSKIGEIGTKARAVYDDVKAQMKGVTVDEERRVRDNVNVSPTPLAREPASPARPARRTSEPSTPPPVEPQRVRPATRPKQPVSSTPEPAPERKPSSTAAKDAAMQADRAELGLPELAQLPGVRSERVVTEARRRNAADPRQPDVLVDEALKGEKNFTNIETMQVNLRAAEVKNRLAELRREIASTTDPQVIADRGIEYDQRLSEYDRITEAQDKSGAEWSRAGRARQVAIKEDYTLEGLVFRAKKAKGRDLTGEERSRYEQQSTRIIELESQLAAAQVKAEQRSLDNDIQRSSRQRKHSETKQQLDDEYAQLRADFAQARAEARNVQASGLAGLDPEGRLTKIVAQMARNRIRSGINSTEALVTELYETVRVDGWSRDDVLSVIRNTIHESDEVLSRWDRTRQAQLVKQQAEFERRLSVHDFTTSPRTKPAYTRETLRLQREVEEIKARYNRELYRATRGRGGMITDELAKAANVPKTLKSIGDISAMFRQGGYYALSHPVAGLAKPTQAMLRSFTDLGWRNVEAEIKADPAFTQLRDAGVEFTGVDKADPHLTRREEGFLGGEYLDYIPVAKQVKDFSERTFVSFLDAQRLHVGKTILAGMTEAQRANPAEVKAVARLVNIATGRGSLGRRGNQLAPALNIAMFSPRLLASRVQLLNNMINPVTIARMPPGARKAMIADNVKFLAATGAILGLAKAAGATVSLDPDDAEFLKIRFGDTVYDNLTGLQQPLRYIVNMGRAASPVRSRPLQAGSDFYAGRSMSEMTKQFARSKANPALAPVIDFIAGEDFEGRKFSAKREAVDLITPLPAKDVYEGLKEGGIIGGAKATPTFVGIGVGSYPPAPEKPRTHAEKLARKLLREGMPDEAREEEQIETDREKAQLRARSHAGENVSAELVKLIRAGKITDKQAKRVVQARGRTRLSEDIKSLSADEALRVYSVMDADEKRVSAASIRQKIANSKADAAKKRQFRERARELGLVQ